MRKLSFAVILCFVILNSNAQAQLYGLTYNGGNNDLGTIFHYNTSTASHTLDQSFNGLNGSNPFGSLTLFNGKFYGLTQMGGNGGFDGGLFLNGTRLLIFILRK